MRRGKGRRLDGEETMRYLGRDGVGDEETIGGDGDGTGRR